jgi:hypothetical protein
MKMRVLQVFGGAMLAAGLVVPATAQDKALSDAQVEANVLRALASAPELSTQNIQSSTVFGTVTLSGNVHNEALRTQAENLAARATGVKKVVDQLTLGDTPASANEQAGQEALNQPDTENGNVPQGQVLQSDGTYAPAAPSDQGAPPPPAQAQNGPPQGAPQGGYYSQNGNAPNGYQPGQPPPGRQPMYQRYAPPPGVAGGQRAGLDVTVPAGAMLRIRINRGLDSQHIQPGTAFDGTVLTDVVADGAVAIPRGATVLGTVVDAKKAGAFKGEGELGLQITSVTLGGNVYPVSTEVWQREGRDKAVGTVNNTVGLGALGAIIGAVAGGGEGAAIGAGVGGAAGLAGSAATPRGQIIIPPESVLTFRTAQPAMVKTVSEAEMYRLSYSAGPQQPQGPPRVRYYSPYYGPYYGPGYYPYPPRY